MIICIRLNYFFFKFSKIFGFGARISLFGEFAPKYVINQKWVPEKISRSFRPFWKGNAKVYQTEYISILIFIIQQRTDHHLIIIWIKNSIGFQRITCNACFHLPSINAGVTVNSNSPKYALPSHYLPVNNNSPSHYLLVNNDSLA